MYFLRLDPHLPWQPAAIEAAKRAMYDGFRSAVEGSPLRNQFGIIVDHRSTMILRDAIEQGFRTACTVDSIGGPETDGEDSDQCRVHPFADAASYWRVVVRFNPADEGALTARQLARLRHLSDDLRQPFGPRLLCDLVVPPTQWQLTHGIQAFDRQLLPELTGTAIARLADAGVAPDLWTIEGFEHPAAYEQVLAVALRAPTAGCLVRAAGHSDVTTFNLMAVGLATPGIRGVVLGPAPFWQPAVTWMMARTTRSRAVAGVAEQFRSWVDRLEMARTAPGQTVPGDPLGSLRGVDERADAGA